MTRLKLALTICAAVLFANACTADPTNTNETARTNTPPSTNAIPAAATPNDTLDELAGARTIFSATCANCHQQNGEGGAVELDEGGTLKVPSFKTGTALKESDAEFAEQIANGGDGMPAFKKRLTPEQIRDLVRFIRREFQSGLVK
ncbi:MAG: c-type cytochrome [Acidobacteriota bacterium]|nr:c-type cytochrome [Acidobacteriota bacterium]